MSRRRRIIGVGVAAGAALAGSLALFSPERPALVGRSTGGHGGPPPVPIPASVVRTGLSCGDLTTALRQVGLARLGSVELAGWGRRGLFATDTALAAGGGVPAAGSVPGPAGAGKDAGAAPAAENGTNVQEVGVDEADVAKVAGRYALTVDGARLHVTDVSTDTPRDTGDVGVPEGAILLVSGDRVLALGMGQQPTRFGGDDEGWYQAWTRAVLVRIGADGSPKVLERADLEGQLVDARATGDAVRVVLTSVPTGLLRRLASVAEQPATAQVRAVKQASWADWLPRTQRTKASGELIDAGALTNCSAVSVPTGQPAAQTSTVVTYDLGRGLDAVDTDTVVGGAGTVYASRDRLYLTVEDAFPVLSRPGPGPSAAPRRSTVVQAFDVSSPGRTDLVAAGKLDGTLLNRWALSERAGFLRVALTTGAWDDRSTAGLGALDVLAERSGELVRVGHLEGLGEPGEQVRGVRFLDTTALVVTFRQTDPLYAIDLTEPTAPKLLGSVKVPGFSAYLHPLGGGLFLGIGQDADSQGRNQGVQASVFDLTDPAAPNRVSVLTFPDSYTTVEYDAHTFTWLPASRQALLPITGYPTDGTGMPSARLVALKVGSAGQLARAGVLPLSQAKGWSRALPAGERLVVVDGGRLRLVAPAGLTVLGVLDW